MKKIKLLIFTVVFALIFVSLFSACTDNEDNLQNGTSETNSEEIISDDWIAVWEKDNYKLIIVDGGTDMYNMYYINPAGDNFSFFASKNEINDNVLESVIKNQEKEFNIEYTLTLNNNSLEFVHNHDDKNEILAGTYMKTNKNPYIEFDKIRY